MWYKRSVLLIIYGLYLLTDDQEFFNFENWILIVFYLFFKSSCNDIINDIKKDKGISPSLVSSQSSLFELIIYIWNTVDNLE